MVEFVIDNINVEFGGHVYKPTVGIPTSIVFLSYWGQGSDTLHSKCGPERTWYI